MIIARALRASPRTLVLLSWLVAFSGCDDDAGKPAAAPPTAAPAPSSAAPAKARPDARQEILRLIQSSQREGIAKRSGEAYMRIWAPEARIVSGRGPEPGEHDHVVDYAAMKRAAFARTQGDTAVQRKLDYSDEAVRVRGEQATVTWTLTTRWRHLDGTSGQERVAERYELRRESARWLVTENRFWPLSIEVGGKTTVFDDAKWKELDEAVEKTDVEKHPMERCRALNDAGRLKEGFELARKLTTDQPEVADGWVWRARFAERMRHIEETVESYRKLKELDPNSQVPGWVKVELAKSQ